MRGIDDIALHDTILIRLDLNSAVDEGVVQDSQRFARHAATVQTLADRGHVVVCLAHQGRPNKPTFLPLAQHASILQGYLDGHTVQYVDDIAGANAIDAITRADSGDVILLENVRMHPDELPERPINVCAQTQLVTSLAGVVDAFVNDAFSVAHRSHASVVGFPSHLPFAAGPVMQSEYQAATSLRERSFDGPVVFLSGGVKADDVLHVMQNVDDVVDTFLVAGVLGELFLRAEGHPVGVSVNGDAPYEQLWTEGADDIGSLLTRRRDDIILPRDLATQEGGQRREHPVEHIEAKNTPYLDIGSETIEAFAPVIEEAAAVFMKGAPGVFEDDLYSKGTIALLQSMSTTDAYTVIGGGDTARAIPMHGFDASQFSHVSIAGGAYIRALTGDSLPAIQALEEAQ